MTCGAQRLTASEVKAHIKPGKGASGHVLMCSTPYGIRGKSTQKLKQLWKKRDSAQRLTASEVKALIFIYFRAISEICAQRLTASEVKAPWAIYSHLVNFFICAQRLTASEVKAPARRFDLRKNPSQCSTPYGIRGKSTWGMGNSNP